MNEIKRYDQALADQLEHLPMPPEDMAWAEMKKLLEKDDDDRVVIPFFRRPGCLLAGLVAALLLLIGGWLYFKRDVVPVPESEQTVPVTRKTVPGSGSNNNDSNNNSSPVNTAIPGNTNDTGRISTTASSANDPSSATSTSAPDAAEQHQPGNTTTGLATNSKPSVNAGNKKRNIAGRSKITITAPGTGEETTGKRKTTRKPGSYSSDGPRTKARVVPSITESDENSTELTNESKSDKDLLSDPGKVRANIKPGSLDSTITTKVTGKDSNNIVKKDSLPKKKTTPAPEPEEEEKEKVKYWQAAAGLSVYHPIALNGEPTVPYNYYGRKGSLTDYIPSAYFRLYRSRKWFAHIEFRYGAPQSVKPFNYKQVIRDSLQQTFRTVFQLQKTYYHQVPVSFNYYVLPGLSLGGGIIYNRFTGAIARQEVYRAGAVDTLLTSGIIRDAEAGKLIKDHFQWSAEAEYQWKRLTIGARYSADINPYIKYTDPGTGTSIEKKAKAFNVFLRYDLWRSKKWGK